MHRGLDTMYSSEALGSLEAKCSKMILDCVDWDSQLDFTEVGKMYDMMYQIYCAKLTEEGQDYKREQNIRDWIREGHRKRLNKGRLEEVVDDDVIVWWIFMGMAVLCSIVYYVCLYFCLNEDQSVDEKYLRRKVEEARKRKEKRLEMVVKQQTSELSKRSIKQS
jgi:hypothetical protein